jgi:flagellar hook assembly protein FlgD
MMRPFRIGPVQPGQPAVKTPGVATATLAINKFELEQNYPNPFNPTTQIKFQLPKEVKVELKVFDLLGRTVRTLVNNKVYRPGSHSVTWDGKNNRGSKVASGMYVYRIKAGSFTKSMKMNLIK